MNSLDSIEGMAFRPAQRRTTQQRKLVLEFADVVPTQGKIVGKVSALRHCVSWSGRERFRSEDSSFNMSEHSEASSLESCLRRVLLICMAARPILDWPPV